MCTTPRYVGGISMESLIVSNTRIFVQVQLLAHSGVPAADLGGTDELAHLEDGRLLLHLCPHTPGPLIHNNVLISVCYSRSGFSSPCQ